MNFKRAFETINSDILLRKLSCYGIKDKELKWFSSYLTRRRQITKVNGVESSMRERVWCPTGFNIRSFIVHNIHQRY